MKNLLLMSVVILALFSCSQDNQKLISENQSLKAEVDLYKEMYASLNKEKVDEFKTNLEEQKKFEENFTLKLNVLTGGKVIDSAKLAIIKNGIVRHKTYRENVMRTPINDMTTGTLYSTSVSTSFFMGVSTMKEMTDLYNDLNKKTGITDPAKWPIQGIGVFIYNNPKTMGVKNNHTDIVFMAVDADGEPVKQLKINEKGKNKTTDVPPYNITNPCPIC